MFKSLTEKKILNAVSKVKKGTIARVVYMTELPVKAEFKNIGFRIVKVVETSNRFGVKYSNIETVKEREESKLPSNRKVTNNFESVVENTVYYNSNTEKMYLQLAGFNKGHHTNSKYVVLCDHPDVKGEFVVSCSDKKSSELFKFIKQMVIDSYWTKKGSPSEIKRISFENILGINNKNVSAGMKTIKEI